MRRADFHYALPPVLIAQQPLPERSASRLLALGPAPGDWRDLTFDALPSLLRAGDLLVWNDTRVIRARLFGRKGSGGRVEILIERLLGPRAALAQLRSSKPNRPGTRISLADGSALEVGERTAEGFFRIDVRGAGALPEILERCGHMPLPPYIARPDAPEDAQRYQTVFAAVPGAVAAPTAGLHFDRGLIERLRERGVEFGSVTLHVGAGTFTPVRVDELREHRMHAEWLRVDERLCGQVNAARARAGRVIAVGTTSVRALETAALAVEAERAAEPGNHAAAADMSRSRGEHESRGDTAVIAPFEGDTRLFITPGFGFRVVDALITNFHLPESTLLMLVCAFGGYGRVMAAYRHAVDARYRFFSYGDAMFLERAAED